MREANISLEIHNISILAEAHNPWVVSSKFIWILHSSQLQLQIYRFSFILIHTGGYLLSVPLASRPDNFKETNKQNTGKDQK